MRHIGFINLYASGYYHRKGKPGTLDVYGADVYGDPEQAAMHAEPGAGFIGTVKIEWDDTVTRVPNAPDSIPQPLSATRREFVRLQRDIQIAKAQAQAAEEVDSALYAA